MAAELTEKQKRFIEEYLVDLNASAAAIRAGYSEKTAYSQGQRLLKNVEIKQEIQHRQNKNAEKLGINVEWVLNNLVEVANRCMQKVPVMYFDKEDKCYKQETAEVEQEDGTIKEEGIWEFNANGANKSLELIGKHLGMFKDRIDINGAIPVVLKDDVTE